MDDLFDKSLLEIYRRMRELPAPKNDYVLVEFDGRRFAFYENDGRVYEFTMGWSTANGKKRWRRVPMSVPVTDPELLERVRAHVQPQTQEANDG